MQKLARLAMARRWWVVGAWLVAIIAIQGISGAAGGAAYKDNYNLPGTETQKVVDLFKSAGLDKQNNASGDVVLNARSGTLTTDPAGFVTKAAAALCADGKAHVIGLASPWGGAACANGKASAVAAKRPDLLAKNQKVAIVEVTFDAFVPTLPQTQAVYKDLKKLRTSTLQVEFTGDTFTGVDAGATSFLPLLIGFLAAIIIMFVVFRTLLATMLPILSAIAALGTGLGLMALLSHVFSVASWAPQLAELMVVGVGIDYALFVVTRHRRNLIAGMPLEDSIASALNTAGRAVLFAGSTVCIAILGMCALGVSFLYGVAITTSIGVLLTMIASLTLLPAMLRFIGLKVLPRQARAAVRAGEFRPLGAAHGRWFSFATLIEKRSWLFAAVGAAIVVVLALPFFSMNLGHADQSNDAKGSTTRAGFDLIEDAFGKGYNSLLSVVVDGPQASDQAFLAKVKQTLRTTKDISPASVTVIPATKNIALIAIKSVSGPQDNATTDLVGTLRHNTLPPLYQGTQSKVYVAGSTAGSVDFTSVLASKIVYFILAVVGLSFLLLMMAFRSIVIPLMAATMNFLAAGASFGVVVAIFQWGWLGDQIGVGAGGPIESFIPVIFFSILFGLSMDYQVFLVSRMHEEWIHTRDNNRAVTVGQAETGGIITAAALIMISVFGGFILGDERFIKLLGIGLASAIFLDAFVVRTLIVPALMHKIGKANWWYPAALEKVTPKFSIDAPDDPSEARVGDPDGSSLVRV